MFGIGVSDRDNLKDNLKHREKDEQIPFLLFIFYNSVFLCSKTDWFY